MNNSYWVSSSDLMSFSGLDKNLDVDVCIVGGGLTGLSTAYYLTKNNYNVCILEKERICSHASRKYNGKNYFSAWTFL